MKYLILIPGTIIGPGEQLNEKMHFSMVDYIEQLYIIIK